MNDQTIIEAEGLSKVYWDGVRPLEILKDVSFSVRRGEGVAILGPSGSGKTTLLNLLSGLDRPTSGGVKIEGAWLHSMDERRLSRLRNETFGFVFQFYHLLTELTALENVMLPAMVGGQMKGRVASQIRERGRLLLERVGLGDRINHFPTELSGGEQQRTAIARALVNDPRIVFCDEPTGNLDARIGDGIVSLLSDLFRKEGKTLIVVTHDEKMAKMADRVWNISKKDWENAYHVA